MNEPEKEIKLGIRQLIILNPSKKKFGHLIPMS